MRPVKAGGTVDRRGFLAGAAALAACGLARPASAFGRLDAGDGELLVVSDGHLTLPLGFVFPDIDRAELEPLLAEWGMAGDTLTPDCNVTFLRRGDRLVVFDVGAGPHFMPGAGTLLDNLAEAGIEPADVTDVVFTHAHPDHLWGLVDDFDELVFPEAGYHMAEAEWDFWRASGTLDAMPEERKSFVVGARSRLALIEERVTLFRPGAEVVPGVEAVDTRGHTPGHVSFAVHGGATPVMILGDAVTNVAVSFARPDWPTASDQDREQGAATRLALLDRLAAEKMRIVGFHLPHPGAGTVEREGAGYRFAAA